MDLVVKMLLNSKDFESGIVNAKAKMNIFSSSTKQVSESFKKSFAVISKAAGALGVAVSAGKIAKDFVNASQTIGDKWNNTMIAAKESYGRFVFSISSGTSDILKNFQKSIQAARDFAAEMDALGSAKISNQYARLKYMNPFNEAILNAQNKGNTKEQRESYLNQAKGIYESYKSNADIVKDKAINSVILKLKTYLPGYNINEQNIMPLVDELYLNTINGIYNAETKRYKELTSKDFWKGNAVVNSKSQREKAAESVMLGEGYSRQQISQAKMFATLSEVNDEELKMMLEIISSYENVRNELIGMQRRMLRPENALMSSGGTTGDSSSKRLYDSVVLDIPDAKPIMQIEETIAKLPAEIDALTPVLEQLHEEWMKNLETMNLYAQAIGSIGGAFSSLSELMNDDSPAKAAMASMAALANAAQTMIGTYTSLAAAATASGAMKAGESIPWPYNMIAMVSYAATAFSTIASIKSTIGGYAYGGIVPGNSYSGDNVLIRANSGEMVLNDAQQDNLWYMLNHGGGSGGGRVQFVIEGQTLKGVLDNYDKTSNL